MKIYTDRGALLEEKSSEPLTPVLKSDCCTLIKQLKASKKMG